MRYLLSILLALLTVVPALSKEPITRVFLVEEAQTHGHGLTAGGYERTLRLAQALQTVRLDALYGSSWRSEATLHEVSRRANLGILELPAQHDDSVLWTQLLNKHRGQSVVVAGDASWISQTLTPYRNVLGADSKKRHRGLYELRFQGDKVQGVAHSFSLLRPQRGLSFWGDFYEEADISAVALVGQDLVVGSDEGRKVQLLKRLDSKGYKVVQSLSLPEPSDSDDEVDVEGLCVQGRQVFVLGSHAKKRKKVASVHGKSRRRSYAKNRERLTKSGVKTESTRNRLYRIDARNGRLDAERVSFLDLSNFLSSDPVSAPFYPLPSKENGVDIEGLASRNGRLFLGFRGPVLRGGWAPILNLEFDNPQDARWDFVSLGGRGIRSLCGVSDGFLVLAGPVGDSDQSFQLYHWDGRDTLPGVRLEGEEPQGFCRLLGEFEIAPGSKAEGMTLLGEADDVYELLVVCDGALKGRPQVYRIPK